MIKTLNGICTYLDENNLVLEIKDIGYNIEFPSNIRPNLNKGDRIFFWIYTYVKEDILRLYGFLEKSQLDIFEILISINGIGAKVALSILSTLNSEKIKLAVETDEPKIFEMVSGIGKRTAEKILIDLKPKVKNLFQNFKDTKNTNLHKNIISDLKSALSNLGFNDKIIYEIINKMDTKSFEKNNLTELIKEALNISSILNN